MSHCRVILVHVPRHYLDALDALDASDVFLKPVEGGAHLPVNRDIPLGTWWGRWVTRQIIGCAGVGLRWEWHHQFVLMPNAVAGTLHNRGTTATAMSARLRGVLQRIGSPSWVAWGALGVGTGALLQVARVLLAWRHLSHLPCLAYVLSLTHNIRATRPNTRIQPVLHRWMNVITRALSESAESTMLLLLRFGEAGYADWWGRGNRAFHDFIDQVGALKW